MKAKTNLTMLCDFYELTMGNGYFQTGLADRMCYFDVFYRSVPDRGGFAIAAGLAQVVEYIENLCFDEEDIAYLRSKGCFSEEFLEYLSGFSFTGDIWAVPEGTPIFPGEPILTVRAPAIQAQFIETFVLLCLNHQCLIATKSNRIVRAAEGRPVAEFGSRRAHGPDGALLGAGRPTSRLVPPPPAPWPTSITVPPPRGPWPTPGCRCSPTSTPPSRPTVSCIPPTRPCW